MHIQFFFNDIRILSGGTESCVPAKSCGPNFRNYHVIHFITKGKGTFTVQGKTYALSEGDGFYFPKDTVVSYRADEKEPWTYTWISFFDDNIASDFSLIGITKNTPTFHRSDLEFLHCLSELTNALEKGEDKYVVLGRICNVLAMFVRDVSRGNVQEEYVRKATEYMRFHLYGDISVEDVANFVGIEKSYLFKLFKEQLEKTPMAYLTELRMNEAARVLRSSNFLIRDIARNVGYGDQFVFSKAFTKYWGISPSNYRKNHFKNAHGKKLDEKPFPKVFDDKNTSIE